MNGWDAFTWLNAIGLAASAVWMFVLFLRDVGLVWRESQGDDDER